jgi:hypothetical protein
MKMVPIIYILYVNEKNDTCWNCLRTGGRRMKESNGGGEFKHIIFDTL